MFMREDELGKVRSGYFADLILVNGDPLKDTAVLQEHEKLNIIMINGRIHKASSRDSSRTSTGSEILQPTIAPLLNLITYKGNRARARIGYLKIEEPKVTPLAMSSGAPLSNLYHVIELDNQVIRGGDPIALQTVKLLPPISRRDNLGVGRTYTAHAQEFNKSGYDSSDNVDQPLHPAGFGIDEKSAMGYVWGYTIINDVIAREKQRDHKQFFIGKSADTFCPIGPITVPIRQLPKTLQAQTYINGQKRQDGSAEDLIFSVANLIKTLSEGITLQPGDVIATGTPPAFSIPVYILEISNGDVGLTKANDNFINIQTIGTGTEPIIYIHGLGGTMEIYQPLIDAGNLKDTHKHILYDLEGHGATPTKASSAVTMDTLVVDLVGVLAATSTDSAIVVAHSLGGLIGLNLALKYPS
ncbi:MAG: hypothetical protein Q9218_008247, partial [Villophora microphyllina]